MFKFILYLGLFLAIQVLHCQAKLRIKNENIGLKNPSLNCSELNDGPVVFYRIIKNPNEFKIYNESVRKEFEINKNFTLNCTLDASSTSIAEFQLNFGEQDSESKATEFILKQNSLNCSNYKNKLNLQRDFQLSPLMKFNTFDLESFNDFELKHDPFVIFKSKTNETITFSCKFTNSSLNENFEATENKEDKEEDKEDKKIKLKALQAKKIRYHVNAASVWEFLIDKLENCDFNQTISGSLIEKKRKIDGPLFTDNQYDVDSSVLKFLALKDPIGTYETDIYCESLGYSEHFKLNISVNATISGDNSTRVVTVGSFKELTCSILSGNYRDAEWKWFKEDIEITNESAGYQITNAKHESRLKILDATLEHSGTYKCQYKNRFSKDDISIKVEIKGILGALWPFIASSIFAIACTIIIVVVEKRANKRSDVDH